MYPSLYLTSILDFYRYNMLLSKCLVKCSNEKKKPHNSELRLQTESIDLADDKNKANHANRVFRRSNLDKKITWICRIRWTPICWAVAGLGMLSTISIGLAIDAYGPISNNAGGIAEMAGMSHRIRERTDALDAA